MDKVETILSKTAEAFIALGKSGGDTFVEPALKWALERTDAVFLGILALIVFFVYIKMRKSIKAKNTQKEEKYPELERLKSVKITTEITDKGKRRLGFLDFLFWLLVIILIFVFLHHIGWIELPQ